MLKTLILGWVTALTITAYMTGYTGYLIHLAHTLKEPTPRRRP